MANNDGKLTVREQLRELRNKMALNLYGMTLDEAHRTGVCLKCEEAIFLGTKEERTKPGCIYSYSGQREYAISGLCEHCFDEIMEVEVGTNSWEAQLVGGPTEPTQQLPSKI